MTWLGPCLVASLGMFLLLKEHRQQHLQQQKFPICCNVPQIYRLRRRGFKKPMFFTSLFEILSIYRTITLRSIIHFLAEYVGGVVVWLFFSSEI